VQSCLKNHTPDSKYNPDVPGLAGTAISSPIGRQAAPGTYLSRHSTWDGTYLPECNNVQTGLCFRQPCHLLQQQQQHPPEHTRADASPPHQHHTTSDRASQPWAVANVSDLLSPLSIGWRGTANAVGRCALPRECPLEADSWVLPINPSCCGP